MNINEQINKVEQELQDLYNQFENVKKDFLVLVVKIQEKQQELLNLKKQLNQNE